MDANRSIRGARSFGFGRIFVRSTARGSRIVSVALAVQLWMTAVGSADLRLEPLTTLALDHPEFVEPVAVAIGPLGQLFVADLGRGTVVRIDSTAQVEFEFETPPGQPDLQPVDLDVTGFKVYVLDAESNALLRYNEDGAYLDLLQSFAREAIETPRALSVDGIGRVLLANAARHSARILSETQQTETLVGGYGSRPGELSSPGGAAFAPDGSFYVADTGNRRIQRYSGVGNLERSYAEGLTEPRGMAVAATGHLFVADASQRRLNVYDDLARQRATLEFPGLTPTDVCTLGDIVWVLSTHPPVLVRVRFVRGE